MALPLKTWIIPLKNMGSPLKDFVKIKASAPKNSIFFFTLHLKKSSIFFNLPLENSMVPQPGGADIKCNSPMPFETCLVKTWLRWMTRPLVLDDKYVLLMVNTCACPSLEGSSAYVPGLCSCWLG